MIYLSGLSKFLLVNADCCAFSSHRPPRTKSLKCEACFQHLEVRYYDTPKTQVSELCWKRTFHSSKCCRDCNRRARGHPLTRRYPSSKPQKLWAHNRLLGRRLRASLLWCKLSRNVFSGNFKMALGRQCHARSSWPYVHFLAVLGHQMDESVNLRLAASYLARCALRPWARVLGEN